MINTLAEAGVRCFAAAIQDCSGLGLGLLGAFSSEVLSELIELCCRHAARMWSRDYTQV